MSFSNERYTLNDFTFWNICSTSTLTVKARNYSRTNSLISNSHYKNSLAMSSYTIRSYYIWYIRLVRVSTIQKNANE